MPERSWYRKSNVTINAYWQSRLRPHEGHSTAEVVDVPSVVVVVAATVVVVVEVVVGDNVVDELIVTTVLVVDTGTVDPTVS
jgi:hypothetical protein